VTEVVALFARIASRQDEPEKELTTLANETAGF
jgi:hypothetical protein